MVALNGCCGYEVAKSRVYVCIQRHIQGCTFFVDGCGLTAMGPETLNELPLMAVLENNQLVENNRFFINPTGVKKFSEFFDTLIDEIVPVETSIDVSDFESGNPIPLSEPKLPVQTAVTQAHIVFPDNPVPPLIAQETKRVNDLPFTAQRPVTLGLSLAQGMPFRPLNSGRPLNNLQPPIDTGGAKPVIDPRQIDTGTRFVKNNHPTISLGRTESPINSSSAAFSMSRLLAADLNLPVEIPVLAKESIKQPINYVRKLTGPQQIRPEISNNHSVPEIQSTDSKNLSTTFRPNTIMEVLVNGHESLNDTNQPRTTSYLTGQLDVNPIAEKASMKPAPGVLSTPNANTLHLNSPQAKNELIERITWMYNNKVQSVNLKVSPPDLGSIDVKLTINGDKADLVIKVQSVSVKELIDSALPKLKSMLENNDLQLGNVTVGRSGSQSKFANQGQNKTNWVNDGDNTSTEDELAETEIEKLQVSVGNNLIDYYA